jgi:hypothetical protein
MVRTDYAFALALYSNDGTPLGQVSVDVDWEPAVQHAWFQAVRQGRVLDDHGPVVQPIWHTTMGVPYLEGTRVQVGIVGGAGPIASDFSSRYFTSLAREASALLVESGRLKEGDQFRFVPMAFPRREPAGERAHGWREAGLVVEDLVPALVFHPRSLATLDAFACGSDEMNADDIPVFVPRDVLRQIAEQTKRAGDVETGGGLIGYLHRDPDAGDAFVRITSNVPATHTVAASARLTFTARTWSEMRAAIAQRGRDEQPVGWYHSHGTRFWCTAGKRCTRSFHDACTSLSDCFSEDDRVLHRTVFPAAYSVALVANDVSVAQMRFAMFGWRGGQIERRGFYVQEEATDVP